MPEGFHLLYGEPSPRGGRRHVPGGPSDSSTRPSPYWFEGYRGFAEQPHLIANYSGTENWIIRYHRLPSDVVLDVTDTRGEYREKPDEHLLRFHDKPTELISIRVFREDGQVVLEDDSHVWIAPGSELEALDCARRAWEEFEPDHSGAWREAGAIWRFCPDQELVYWSAKGLNQRRLAVRASRDPKAIVP